MPVRVANEPYLSSFQYKVLNSVLFTNDRPCKIGFVSNPNCTFCHQLTETISHLLLGCSFSYSFWHEKFWHIAMLLLRLSKRNLFNYIVILGKSFLLTCLCRETLPSLSHFIRILVIKYETGKLIFQIEQNEFV